MTKFTIEDLRDIAYRGSYDDLERELALQLLASMEQEPVAWTSQRSLEVRDKITAFTDEQSARDYGKRVSWSGVVPLYAAPQQEVK